MSWASENGVWKVRKVLERLFSKEAKVTNHFAIRLMQRFDVEQRRKIIHELYHVLRSGMYPALVETDHRHANVIINNRYLLAVAINPNGRLILKTIYDPEVPY